MNALALLFALTSTLVLRSGERIVVDDGTIRQESGVMTFRSGGALYSLPTDEVARIETGTSAETKREVVPSSQEPEQPRVRLRLSEEERKRVLAELEQNHSGGAAPRQKILEEVPREKTPTEQREQRRDESTWRRQARMYEENVLRAREELALLEARIEELESKIQSLVALGYRAHQFSYDSTQLIRTREQLPYAQLQVTRAERALERFRDDARREGVMPGWLR